METWNVKLIMGNSLNGNLLSCCLENEYHQKNKSVTWCECNKISMTCFLMLFNTVTQSGHRGLTVLVWAWLSFLLGLSIPIILLMVSHTVCEWQLSWTWLCFWNGQTWGLSLSQLSSTGLDKGTSYLSLSYPFYLLSLSLNETHCSECNVRWQGWTWLQICFLLLFPYSEWVPGWHQNQLMGSLLEL